MTKKDYIEAVGRRKTATARVRIEPAKQNTITVNGKTLNEYFPVESMHVVAQEALDSASQPMTVSARVSGGGLKAQAEAIRHGISRALVAHTPEVRKDVKQKGFLTRDARMKERKKFGLKAARRAPQWSKR